LFYSACSPTQPANTTIVVEDDEEGTRSPNISQGPNISQEEGMVRVGKFFSIDVLIKQS
jgi:hypothetical protein